MPSEYTRRYNTAWSRTSSGVPRSSSMGRDTSSPMARRRIPPATPSWAVAATAARTPAPFRCPIHLAITTFTPTASPMNIFTIKLITGPLLPTAAKAWLPVNRPTTATSTELNDCCSMPLAISGKANIIIGRASGPDNISIFFVRAIFYCKPSTRRIAGGAATHATAIPMMSARKSAHSALRASVKVA